MSKETASNNKEIFPIRKGELMLFFTVSIMMILTLYVYSVLRNTKDVLILSNIGAELLSTVKLYGVLPSAIIFMIVYTKLANTTTRLNIYYILIAFFAVFFAGFALFMYPNIDSLKIDVSSAIESTPYLKYILLMISYWPYALFYIMSELWGSVMVSLMFWQLVNQIVSIEQAKRFYPLFGFLGQIGLLSSGLVMKAFGVMEISWGDALNYVIISVIVSAVIMVIALYFLSNNVVNKEVINGVSKKKSKSKAGVVESLKYVLSSRYIGLITMLVVCYGISINLVEGVWKKKIELYFAMPTKIGVFMADVQIYTAIMTFVMMLVASYVLRRYSWKVCAMITPIMLGITGVLFFIFVSSDKQIEAHFAMMTGLAALLAVLCGAAQNVLSKSTKYSLFDSTKEMTYIPLDEDLKAKGKAAADVIGGRLGKSGGAVVQWSLLTIFPSMTLIDLAPSLFGVFVVIIVMWGFSVNTLSGDFKQALKTKEEAA
ncbi:MAG: NTP/NDP exchange transporter [Rickettsiales bacterium]|nr:NTP/NDP exchange transporter [Rickettsiales bacterium]